jgi:hypothetical protein
MKFVLFAQTNFGRRRSLTNTRIGAVVKLISALALSTTLFACAGYSSQLPSETSALAGAASAEIDHSNATGNKDTQCSTYVAHVLRRLGLDVPGFRANDFDQIMETYLPSWKMTEFTSDELSANRSALRQHLNQFPDHTAFLAQWPRTNESGHVAVVEKIADDSYLIYQAQAGTNVPYKKPIKIESLLYGTLGVARSRLRLWAE